MRAGKSVDLNTLDYLFCVGFLFGCLSVFFVSRVRRLGVLLNFCILSLLTACFPR